jgi:hypothetical protein
VTGSRIRINGLLILLTVPRPGHLADSPPLARAVPLRTGRAGAGRPRAAALRPSGTAPVNGEFLTPGCLLNARPTLTPPATTRAADNE